MQPAIQVAKVFAGVALVLGGAVADSFKAVTGFMKDHATLVQTIAVAVLAGVAAYKAYQFALLSVQVVGNTER